jgi:hypothetical protein
MPGAVSRLHRFRARRTLRAGFPVSGFLRPFSQHPPELLPFAVQLRAKKACHFIFQFEEARFVALPVERNHPFVQ